LSTIFGFSLLGSQDLPFSSKALAAEPVRIGLLIPPQETGSELDSPYLRGAEIGVAEVNANEGKTGMQLLLVIRRGSYIHNRELIPLRELFFEERIHFLMGAIHREAILPVSRLAQEQRTPFLVFPLNFIEVASTGDEPSNLFWISPSPEAFQRAAARTAAQFPKKRFYLLARNSTFGRGWVKYFWEEIRKLKPDAQRMGETFLPARVDEFGPYIQYVLSANADACLSHLGTREWIRFAQVANQQRFFEKVTHFEMESGSLESLMALKKKGPEGVWGVSAFPFWALGGKESKAFVAKYKRNTGSYPPLAALSGYVSIQAIFQTLKKAGSLDPEKAMTILEGLVLPTPVGQLAIRKSDHRVMWPIWSGSTKITSDYPFPILGNLKALGPDSFSP